MNQLPILYIKQGCPWCQEALAFFKAHQVSLDIRDVRSSQDDLERLQRVSGQSLTPTLESSEVVIADFSVKEFLAALDKHPALRSRLGLDGVRG